MNLKAAVIGLGKLGSSMLAVMASKGISTFGYDIDDQKIDLLQRYQAPVYEPNIGTLIADNQDCIVACETVQQAILAADISFIVVPTPSRSDGSFETEYAVNCAKEIGNALRAHTKYHVVVLTSTLLPGDCRRHIITEIEAASGKQCGTDFGFCYSPEFIALGTVVQDLLNPDYFLVGQFDEKSGEYLGSINRTVTNVNIPISFMSIEEAEIAKIATNAFITMKINFANSIKQAASVFPDAVAEHITQAIGQDRRIGRNYLSGGLSYGGPCFPRDNRAVGTFFQSENLYENTFMKVHESNEKHADFMAERILQMVESDGPFLFVGASYKPKSNLLTESPTLKIVDCLVGRGRTTVVYDELADILEPQAEAEKYEIKNNLAACIKEAKVLIMCHRDQQLFNEMVDIVKNRPDESFVIVDCWNNVDRTKLPSNASVTLL